ncbi:hypothetical protein [Streptomyces klenkii]|uniref:hypothetical protein n=1 Tax=Streptomyces klenkii TaxID=1420899 RepID=UPI0034217F46
MTIDRSAAVVPPRFADKTLRKVMGQLISRADDGDLLASFLWVCEGKIARDIHAYLEKHRDRIQRELDYAENRSVIDSCLLAPVDEYYDDIACDTARTMERLLSEAQAFCDLSTKIRRTMSEDYGNTEKIRAKYTRDTEAEPSSLERLIRIWDAHLDATIKVDKALAEDRNRTHAVALLKVVPQMWSGPIAGREVTRGIAPMIHAVEPPRIKGSRRPRSGASG